MATLYEARGAHWDSETDDWEKGCIAPGSAGYERTRLRAGTVLGILEAIRDHAEWPCALADLVLNACDETGRVDVCGTTTDLEDPRSWATEDEMDKWKRGERVCFYTVWTFYVERVTREAVDLEPVSA